jgi:hypothetical protein
MAEERGVRDEGSPSDLLYRVGSERRNCHLVQAIFTGHCDTGLSDVVSVGKSPVMLIRNSWF